MPLSYLGSDLVRSIRNVGMVPNTGATGTQAVDLLRAASEGIRAYLLAKIHSVQEEYFVFRIRTALIGGTAKYRLPPRAIFQKLRDIWFFNGTSRFRINKAPEEDIDRYGISVGSQPVTFLLEGNDVVLIPDLNSAYSGFLEMAFYCRPGDLVLETAARQIPVGGIVGKVVTFATALPTSWTTANTFDVHSQHSGAELKLLDAVVTAASGAALTFTDAIDGTVYGTKRLEAGDWVCLTGDAALPGVPAELHPIVAEVAAMILAKSVGDQTKMQMHGTILTTFLKENLAQMEQRAESKPWRVGGSKGLLGSNSIRRRY